MHIPLPNMQFILFIVRIMPSVILLDTVKFDMQSMHKHIPSLLVMHIVAICISMFKLHIRLLLEHIKCVHSMQQQHVGMCKLHINKHMHSM